MDSYKMDLWKMYLPLLLKRSLLSRLFVGVGTRSNPNINVLYRLGYNNKGRCQESKYLHKYQQELPNIWSRTWICSCGAINHTWVWVVVLHTSILPTSTLEVLRNHVILVGLQVSPFFKGLQTHHPPKTKPPFIKLWRQRLPGFILTKHKVGPLDSHDTVSGQFII